MEVWEAFIFKMWCQGRNALTDTKKSQPDKVNIIEMQWRAMYPKPRTEKWVFCLFG